MSEPFIEKNYRTGEFWPIYRGFVRTGPGPKDRQKVKLYTDLKVSQRELRRLQGRADDAMQNPELARRKEFGSKSIEEHFADYLACLSLNTKNKDHCRIAECMLMRLARLAGWRRLSDITEAGMVVVLKDLALKDGRPATVSYKNCFVKRAKAFTAWCVPGRQSAGQAAPAE